MLSRLHDPSLREEGFTLIELLIAIIIIGILAAIAIPLFLDQRKLAVDAGVRSDVRSTVTKVNTSFAADPTIAPAAVPPVTSASLGPEETVQVVPDTGGNFIVYGYNSKGKNLASNKSAFTFKSATGQFTTSDVSALGTPGSSTPAPSTSAPAPAPSPTTVPSSTPTPTSTTAPGASTGIGNGYAATVQNVSLNDGINTVLASQTYAAGGFTLGAGLFQPPASGPVTGSQPLINGIVQRTAENASTRDWYRSWILSDRDVHLYTKDGTEVSTARGCQVEAYWVDSASFGSSFGYTGTGTGFVLADVDCNGKGPVLTAAQAANLKGGLVIFNTPEGDNIFSITADVPYQP